MIQIEYTATHTGQLSKIDHEGETYALVLPVDVERGKTYKIELTVMRLARVVEG